MSKVTFRADDDLVTRLEALDTSKSEAMREALREYLDRQTTDESGQARDVATTREATSTQGASPARDASSTREATTTNAGEATLDQVIGARIDELLEPRVDRLVEERLARQRRPQRQPQDIDLTINVDGVRAPTETVESASERTANRDGETQATSDPEQPDTDCGQCGESMSDDHVYCPNCGEKRSHRVFCDCGDEVRSDWAFCPSCGRRTPAADVLEGR